MLAILALNNMGYLHSCLKVYLYYDHFQQCKEYSIICYLLRRFRFW